MSKLSQKKGHSCQFRMNCRSWKCCIATAPCRGKSLQQPKNGCLRGLLRVRRRWPVRFHAAVRVTVHRRRCGHECCQFCEGRRTRESSAAISPAPRRGSEQDRGSGRVGVTISSKSGSAAGFGVGGCSGHYSHERWQGATTTFGPEQCHAG
jgi:hypothetical protein